MTTDVPRRYRFAAFRRAGLFGNVPPSLLITLAIGVIAGWLAVLSQAPLLLAVAPLLACALVGFGRLGGRPIHELLPRLAVWGWRRVLGRHRWCRPIPSRSSPIAESRTEPDATLLEYVAGCERILWRPTGQKVLNYLVDERGLAPDALKANHVGADLGPAAMRRAAGLPRGGIAAVLATLDIDGRVAYVQARYIEHVDGRPKYDNPASRIAANPRIGWVPTATLKDRTLRLPMVALRIDGTSMLVGFELDLVEHARRARSGLGALTSTELLHGLWLLPSGVPVPLTAIPPKKVERLRAASHSVELTSSGFERLYSPPGVVRSVAFVGRNADHLVQRAIRFTPIFQRIAVVMDGRRPLSARIECTAREWAVGIVEVNSGATNCALSAGRAETGVPSVYRWWMAELAYQSWLYENAQLVS